MRLKNIIIILLCLTHYCFATIHVQNYSLSSGMIHDIITVGQDVEILILNKITLYTGFESYMKKFNTTYFSPSIIDYRLGIKIEHLGWEHSCMHSLDSISSSQLPIRDRFYLTW